MAVDAAIIADGYGFEDEQPIVRTPMEQGPERKVRISLQYSTFVSVQCLLTASQLSTYRTYYEGSECQMGAGWFDMNIVTTEGVAAHEVRIETARVNRISSDLFRLAMQIETRERIA